MRRSAGIAVAALLLLATTAGAATIEVSGEPGTALGDAIIAAEPGDTLQIPPGEWILTEGDVLEEKDLTLVGAGEDKTIVLPSGGGLAFDDTGVETDELKIGDPLNPPGGEEDAAEDGDGIETKAQIIALVVTFAIFLFVLDLVRRRRLSERYAIIWMIAALALLVLSIWTGGLDAIAELMGIQEPANAIFIIAFAVGFLLLLNFSVVSSRLGEEAKVLAQEVARLDEELRVERSLRGGEGNGFSGRTAKAEDAEDQPPVRAE